MPRPAPRDGTEGRRTRRWSLRIAWFIGLWLASVAALGVVAWLIRFWLIG
jgi:hypothetical protein